MSKSNVEVGSSGHNGSRKSDVEVGSEVKVVTMDFDFRLPTSDFNIRLRHFILIKKNYFETHFYPLLITLFFVCLCCHLCS